MQIKRTLIRTLYSLNLPSDVKKGEAVMVKTGFSGKVGGGGGGVEYQNYQLLIGI